MEASIKPYRYRDPGTFLRELFLNENLSDFRLIVENPMQTMNYPAHSFVVKPQSPVIARMLESDFVEGQSQKIVITDFEACHIEMFLKYLYLNVLPETDNSLRELVKLGRKYMVPGLAVRCELRLVELITRETVYELCNLAELHSLTSLYDNCLLFLMASAFLLVKSTDIKCLSMETMEKIVSSDNLNMEEEMDVFSAIYHWGELQYRFTGVAFSNQQVVTVIQPLLNSVRWNLMDEGELDRAKHLGITVPNSASKPVRKPVTHNDYFEAMRFLKGCTIFRVDEHCESRTLINDYLHPSSTPIPLLVAVSLSDAPIYVTGISLQVTKELTGATIACYYDIGEETETTTSYVDEIGSKKPLVIHSSDGEMKYMEVVYEFAVPYLMNKHLVLTILIKNLQSNIGCVLTKFEEGNSFISNEDSNLLFISQDVYAVKNIYIL